VSVVSRVQARKRNNDARAEIVTAPGFTVVADISPQHGAVSGIAVSPDGSRLMVTHYGDHSFSMIDTVNRTVAQTVIDIDEPFAIAMAEVPANRVYVSAVSAAYDSVLAFDVDASRVVAAYPLAHSVTDLAVSPDGRQLYASRTAATGADVAVLDTETGKDDVIGLAGKAGTITECVRISPDGSRLYVAANGPSSAELVVIDTHARRVLNTVEIGSPIRDIALSPDGASAYIGSSGPDFGAVLDVVNTRTNRIANTYKVGEASGFLAQLRLSRKGERAYLVGDTGVTVLSTSTHDVTGSIVLGPRPSCVIESPDGNHLYIADYAGTVTTLAIASTTASPDPSTPEDAPTLPHPELLGLEPAMA
jgi:DNA-binding beta-propeller fold protein YncE